MQSGQEKLHPMTVVTMANARVQDLIGLICWQYTSEGREPKLNENVNAYCLHIAEDDGEVDTDFPPLDSNEPIHKFGFSTLALVENENVNAYCLHIAEDDGEVDTDFPPLDSNEPIHKFGFSTLALVEKYSSPGLAAKQSLFVRIVLFSYSSHEPCHPSADAKAVKEDGKPGSLRMITIINIQVGRCINRKHNDLERGIVIYLGSRGETTIKSLLTCCCKGHVGTTSTKKIDVYLSMQSGQEKLHPMTVVTMANARVQDLIGLICWQYTSEGREPKLK
ncbi:Target of rapamycin complex 2 subunit MAPKAP1 [Acipenser ruthenus]|uniref:Target of rapamycin complex 2 subunit MAPKAP1 n=1 Tax=Acipenser ruthenus TaxID=7906 RepID=A0A444V316_ACIRT|nr:Target of rapamycin complex 2 subunit MAPKAP1 [Acipenser ruthenus]